MLSFVLPVFEQMETMQDEVSKNDTATTGTDEHAIGSESSDSSGDAGNVSLPDDKRTYTQDEVTELLDSAVTGQTSELLDSYSTSVEKSLSDLLITSSEKTVEGVVDGVKSLNATKSDETPTYQVYFNDEQWHFIHDSMVLYNTLGVLVGCILFAMFGAMLWREVSNGWRH